MVNPSRRKGPGFGYPSTNVITAATAPKVPTGPAPAAGHHGRETHRLDTSLGVAVLVDPRPALRDRARAWLGTDRIATNLRRIEDHVTAVIDLLNSLAAQQEAVSAAQATSFHNIDVAVQELRDAVANGDATPEVQAAADKLAAGFAALQQAAEDEGRLYAPDQPADGGDVPDQPAADDTGR